MQLSEQAAAALETIRSNEGVPESHDTRLSAEPQPTGEVAVRIEFVESAASQDEMAQQGNTEIYVDSQIAGQLSDSVMDIQDTEQGLTFYLRPQE